MITSKFFFLFVCFCVSQAVSGMSLLKLLMMILGLRANHDIQECIRQQIHTAQTQGFRRTLVFPGVLVVLGGPVRRLGGCRIPISSWSNSLAQT